MSQDNVDSMTVRLMAAEEELGQERREHSRTRERLHQLAAELETLPLLQAQVRPDQRVTITVEGNTVSRWKFTKATSTRRGRPESGSLGRRQTWRSSSGRRVFTRHSPRPRLQRLGDRDKKARREVEEEVMTTGSMAEVNIMAEGIASITEEAEEEVDTMATWGERVVGGITTIRSTMRHIEARHSTTMP